MSEYWKSTASLLPTSPPKYWCKHCKTYVRDTKLERQNHDATPRHQGSLKRFIRDIHRSNERDEREKQRAKDEVARLNGTAPVAPLAAGPKETSTPSFAQQQATPEERKRQMAQLAALGVAVPEGYRREAAMAGEWQVVAQRPVYSDSPIKKEEDDDDDDDGLKAKPAALNIGVRKRRLEVNGGEGEEAEAEAVDGRRKRPVWGSSMRAYPGAGGADEGLDALLGSKNTLRTKDVGGAGAVLDGVRPTTEEHAGPPPVIKREESNGMKLPLIPDIAEVAVKAEAEEETPDPGSLFKKRKPKAARQT